MKYTLQKYPEGNWVKNQMTDTAYETSAEKYDVDKNTGEAYVFNTEAERDSKYNVLVAEQAIKNRGKDGKAAFIDSAMVSTLITYASIHKTGKVIEIMTVINQVGKAITDDTALVNQDYERLLHSMLIEMYSNHRELYTALYEEEKIQEVYEEKVVVDFLKIVFTNKYITTK